MKAIRLIEVDGFFYVLSMNFDGYG